MQASLLSRNLSSRVMTVCVRGHLVQEEMNRESKPVEEILAHMNEVAENHIVAGGVIYKI